jgi:adenylate kinase
MSETKKFTEEELNKVQELRERMSKLVANFGELKLEQILHDQKTEKLNQLDKTFNTEYANIQKTELELVKEFNEKYGRGTLDLDSGTFSPSN